ncbi:MAG: hypothetical protein LBD75_04790 [Candidatus Peribacteria bacterium]|jgi:translation initiation factor 2 alpha subunit (eIF-2alpha)|nr:hypothetical protein [Candidatus Peribacteria bacterium]
MNDYYKKIVGQEVAEMWNSIAADLAKTYGTDYEAFEPTKDPTTTATPLSSFAEKFEDHLNKQLIIPPVNNYMGSAPIEQNIKNMGKNILLALQKNKDFEKENAEIKKFIDAAIWTNKKGQREYLFDPITL